MTRTPTVSSAPARSPSRLAWVALACGLALGAPAAGAQALGAQALGVQAVGAADLKAAKDAAGAATKHYFEALAAGQCETAARYLHPKMLEGLREEFLRRAESPDPKVQRAVLQELGLKSAGELKRIAAGRLYAAICAAPTYGTPLRAIADPALKATVHVDHVRCAPHGKACDVAMRIEGLRDGKAAVLNTPKVPAVLLDGRWVTGQPATRPKARGPNPHGKAPRPKNIPGH